MPSFSCPPALRPDWSGTAAGGTYCLRPHKQRIAVHLNLADKTVRNHVQRMLRKIGVGDLIGVVDVCRIYSPFESRQLVTNASHSIGWYVYPLCCLLRFLDCIESQLN